MLIRRCPVALLLLALSGFYLLPTGEAQGEEKKPNVLFIVVDDLAAWLDHAAQLRGEPTPSG